MNIASHQPGRPVTRVVAEVACRLGSLPGVVIGRLDFIRGSTMLDRHQRALQAVERSMSLLKLARPAGTWQCVRRWGSFRREMHE